MIQSDARPTATRTAQIRVLDRKPEEKLLVAYEVPKVVSVACRFARARQRQAVVYVLGAGDPAENRQDVPITKRTAEQLENALGLKRFDDLDLIIQSSGGDIHAAYLIISMLQERMKDRKKLTACVPSRAQSAATLLCLGTGTILLDEMSSLGPLDAQIRKGVTDAGTPNYVSALNLLKTLDRLQQFSLESFIAMAGRLYAHHASHAEQIQYGIEYSRAITAPLFDRVDSGEIGNWDQMLRTGEEYGRRVLRRGALIENDQLKIDRNEHIESIVHKLVYGYPSHQLVLDRDALEALHLSVGPISADHGRGDEARRVSREFAECASETLIMVVDPNAYPLGLSPEHPKEAFPLSDWRRIGRDTQTVDPWDPPRVTDQPALDIAWEDDGTTYGMRVGLYRPAVGRRRRWDETARPAADGPATQFSRVSLE